MDKNNTQLEQRIRELEKWREQKTIQQIAFPLDFQSQQILAEHFMHITGTVITVAGAAGNVFLTYIGNQGTFKFQVDKDTFIPYTVNVASNFLSTPTQAFENDQRVYVSTEDTAPTPLSTLSSYFVVNTTGLTYQLSLTQGGAAIDITDDGTGRQYIYFF